MRYRLAFALLSAVHLAACTTDMTRGPSDTRAEIGQSDAIARIESGLRPTYGTADEPVPTWTLQERMEHYDVPAISIAVAIDGELAWARAYGELEKGTGLTVNTNTLFQAASLSKPVASLAALRLVADKQVSLDDPVNAYLSSWQIPDNNFTAKTSVTLRHLLSHRAGTTIHGFRGYTAAEDKPSTVQILEGGSPANTAPVRVNQEPGTAYRYSGGGFTIAQLLIEDVSGTSYADFLEQEIFAPLNLKRSNFAYPQTDENSAIGHTGKTSAPIPQPGRAYPELAAAGLWTTPSDLVFLGAQIVEARHHGNDLLPKHLAQQLVPNSADAHGLGFGLNNAGDGVAFVHNGHNPGFSARWINYEDGRASVAILTNSDTGSDLIREVLSAIGFVYGWKQDGYIERQTVDLSAEWVDAISGGYAFDASSSDPVVTITAEAGKLWLSGAFTDRTRLYAASRHEFFIGKGMNFALETNAQGTPIALDVEGEIRLVKLINDNDT